MYQRGGVFCITSRILIVDLLTNVAQPHDIDGMLVAHAEQVTETSTEAFILRIYKSQMTSVFATTSYLDNKTPPTAPTKGFVKAMTENPDALLSGFSKVDKTLKALHVRKLYLYPRFQDTIRQELESTQHAIQVEELYQELTPRMKEIQAAIASAVQTCLRELQRLTPTLIQWNDADLALENCVTSQFDKAISRQLDSEWHRLSPSVKQLVQDLRTLRTLFSSLIQYDCVTFWKLLNNIKSMVSSSSSSPRHTSMWLFTPAADVLFRTAKERIYVIVKDTPTTKVPRPVSRLIPNLEENPKWRLLYNVLQEINQGFQTKNANDVNNLKQQTASTTAADVTTNKTVLVMLKDERSMDAVRAYLVNGKERTMTLRWLRYLEQYNDRSRSLADAKGTTSAISEESRLLLEEEGRARRLLFGRQDQGREQNVKQTKKKGDSNNKKRGAQSPQLNQVPNQLRKRRKIATERGRGTVQADELQQRAVLDTAVEETEHDMQNALLSKESKQQGRTGDGLGEDHDDDDDIYDKIYNVHWPGEERQVNDDIRVVLKTYAACGKEEGWLLLNEVRPDVIVLYDADMSFVRSVEVYAALRSNSTSCSPMKVYLLLLEASAEEKTFMKSLEREQQAFERLIQHKKTMPLPISHTSTVTQEVQLSTALGVTRGSVGTYMDGTLPLAADTRTGRGKKQAANKGQRRDVAVDVREFRSALPFVLHQGGMRLAPVTLIVGDFVLSQVHCVERKSISDLFGSFASGRLYTQVEQMTKYYACPCLLIEFDPAKSFSLQNSNDLGGDIRTDSVCSKMVLLTIHFPKLRVLWSKSPHESLRIFQALKQSHDEVDVERAVQVGRNDSEEALLLPAAGNEDEEEDEVNEVARDMLLRLPGVNVQIARKIMQHVDTLADLTQLSRDELRTIVGPVVGQNLYRFFRQTLVQT
jgi:DNA excision repair protein ERCC-4